MSPAITTAPHCHTKVRALAIYGGRGWLWLGSCERCPLWLRFDAWRDAVDWAFGHVEEDA